MNQVAFARVTAGRRQSGGSETGFLQTAVSYRLCVSEKLANASLSPF